VTKFSNHDGDSPFRPSASPDIDLTNSLVPADCRILNCIYLRDDLEMDALVWGTSMFIILFLGPTFSITHSCIRLQINGPLQIIVCFILGTAMHLQSYTPSLPDPPACFIRSHLFRSLASD